MFESEEQNLDTEYKRYLEIIRPYLEQLLDQDIIEICNTWIEKLSCCKEYEKSLRNKYIFALCYQLAKGVLEEPFLRCPLSDGLPLFDDSNSDESLSEKECHIIDLESHHTQILYDNEKPSTSAIECISGDSGFKADTELLPAKHNSINSMTYNIPESIFKENLICYNCSADLCNFNENKIPKSSHYRAKNIVTKIRQIKRQNFTLQSELNALKEELRLKNERDMSRDEISKTNTATSTCTILQDSTTTLQFKIQESKESRNSLLKQINNLQDHLNNFEFIKNHEIEDLEAKHKLEIMNIKTFTQDETKIFYENKLNDMKHQFEQCIKDIQTNNIKELEKIMVNKNEEIYKKDAIILSKNLEIERLNKYIEDISKNENSMYSLNSINPNIEPIFNNVKLKTDYLEKRLNKIEKSKLKYSNAYDIKLAYLQREKHLTEYSFHLELVRQRAQVVNQISNEYQTDLATALTKLESKYKEIIGNGQSMAIQRRIQDQMALESIIQAVCGVRNEGMYTNSAQATCSSQLTDKAARNQTTDCIRCSDIELPTVFQGNKVGSIIVGGKSFGEEILVNDYRLDSEKLGELFEKSHIPQRDSGGDSAKK